MLIYLEGDIIEVGEAFDQVRDKAKVVFAEQIDNALINWLEDGGSDSFGVYLEEALDEV